MTHAELGELVASVRALRAENGRLEARLEKLEQQAAVTSTRRAATAAASVSSNPSVAVADDAVPALAVVKLKPRARAAPPINTRVDVVEPSEGLVSDLKRDDKLDQDDAAVADAVYARGLDALKTGNAEAGALQLMQFASEYPRHPRADNALFYVGVAQMAERDFGGAAAQFDRVLANYPAGDAVVESMLKLGECRARLNQPALARAIWEQILSNFPGTPAAAQAEARLASLASKNP